MIEIDKCVERLSGDDEADRIYAAEDIGYANRAEGVPPLLARLSAEPSRAVREAIFAALLQIDGDAAIDGVLGLLDSEDSFLRNQAVEVLRARGSKVVPYLGTAFREGDGDRRKFVVDVLAKLGDDGTSGIYESALADTDLNVVITAVESLGAARRNAFRERIEKLVAPRTHPMLLAACIEALAQIGDAGSVNTVRKRLCGDGGMPGYLQASYLKLLGEKGGREDVEEIAGLMARAGLESYVLNALSSLRSRFRDLALPVSLAQPLQNIASGAASSLMAYQSVRLMAALLHIEEVFVFVTGCLEHGEKAVRIAAVQTLREANSSRAEEFLRERLPRESDEEVLQALTR